MIVRFFNQIIIKLLEVDTYDGIIISAKSDLR